MSSLYDYMDGTNPRPTMVAGRPPQSQQIEPLGGTVSMDDIMGAFPHTVYQQGIDTHLYRFIAALTGEAGASRVLKQAYIARTMAEGEHLVFNDLDTLYTRMFGFRRLRSEIHGHDPHDEALTQAEWDDIVAKDNHFAQRMQDFFEAARWGNSPFGMELSARAGAGVECSVSESYEPIFDALSDDPLGLEFTHPSTGHFEVKPHVTSRTGDVDTSVAYPSDIFRTQSVAIEDGDITQETEWLTNTSQANLLPDLERNIIWMLDRLRPVGASMAVRPQIRLFMSHGVRDIYATTTRFMPTRFVTGREDVNWPEPDASRGFFIESGVESEAPRLAGSAMDFPTIYMTVEGTSAYVDNALYSEFFNTSEFWDDGTSVPPYLNFRSYHEGLLDPTTTSIYPTLQTIESDMALTEDLALAQPFTPLMLIARGM